ncbi:hypothetical protein KI387_031717, partial [Taxus chinensis]
LIHSPSSERENINVQISPRSTRRTIDSLDLENNDMVIDDTDTENVDVARRTYPSRVIQDKQSNEATVTLQSSQDLEEKEQENKTDEDDGEEERSKKVEKQGPRCPPRRVLYRGMGSGSRKNASDYDSEDDTIFVDEDLMCSARGLDLHNASAWGYSSWVQQFTGPACANIRALQVDETTSFDDVGGLSRYIHALKDMVFFPLLFPDFIATYHLSPPRGVLLCGPPGTGKTLIVRALANAASKAGQKVNFYMRKGADVLSKWAGEAERHLKLLFEEAQRNQPSIIFFDEIDGLAPARSSNHEQVHNSVVSTLLALMDGIDSRGQVVLIGATNRIDAIDGALRRPGRFGLEFVFPMPDCKARAEILKIHTRKWKDPLSDGLIEELAASCLGYCGADLKALCTEAAIVAFRHKYPQVYTSDDKFDICADSVKVEKHHFLEAMSTITPAAHRGAIVHSRPLPPIVAPCLEGHLQTIINHLSEIFPLKDSLDYSCYNLASLGISYGYFNPLVYKSRFLICGKEGTGLEYIGPAVIHELESFPLHSIGLPSLLSDPSAETPVEALMRTITEARRTSPSILYLPQLELWWETADAQLIKVLIELMEDLATNLPVLLLATSSISYDELNKEAASLFWRRYVYPLATPSREERTKFFSHLVDFVVTTPYKEAVQIGLEGNTSIDKPMKAPVVARRPSEAELQAKRNAEEHAIRCLRMCLRDVCCSFLSNKGYSNFHSALQNEDVLESPIEALLQKVNEGRYLTLSTFLQDVELIPANANTYYGRDLKSATIVNEAYAIRDEIYGMIREMDPVLISFCDKIAARGGQIQKEKSIRESESHNDIEPPLNITPTSEALKYTNVDLDLAGKNVYAHENKSETMEMKLDAVGHDGVGFESDNE